MSPNGVAAEPHPIRLWGSALAAWQPWVVVRRAGEEKELRGRRVLVTAGLLPTRRPSTRGTATSAVSSTAGSTRTCRMSVAACCQSQTGASDTACQRQLDCGRVGDDAVGPGG